MLTRVIKDLFLLMRLVLVICIGCLIIMNLIIYLELSLELYRLRTFFPIEHAITSSFPLCQDSFSFSISLAVVGAAHWKVLVVPSVCFELSNDRYGQQNSSPMLSFAKLHKLIGNAGYRSKLIYNECIQRADKGRKSVDWC